MVENNKSKKEPIVLERTFDAGSHDVWQAITDKDKMKKWYFDVKDFRPEVGLEFQFYAGDEKKKYLHLWKIKEVIPGKKITYSWKYDYDHGVSEVTFELVPEGSRTKLKLKHEGIHNFSPDHPELAKENFVQGWNEIINTGLKEYLEK